MATNKKHDVENPIVTDGNGDLKHPDDSAHNTSSRKVAVDDIEKPGDAGKPAQKLPAQPIPRGMFGRYKYTMQNQWKGVKPLKFLACIVVFLILRYAVPKPATLTWKAWQLFAIFVATILGLIIEPLPIGAVALIAQAFILLTGTLKFEEAFVAFGANDTIWLIVAAYFFGKACLGVRIANLCISVLGKTSLGLAYGLACAELVLSPAMPSTTARAGGVFVPIIQSLSVNADSHPFSDSSKRLGAFLTMSQFQVSVATSTMWATGAAQNFLCLSLAANAGVPIPGEWVTWLKGSFLPAAVTFAVIPALVYLCFPPQLKKTPEAPHLARLKLKELGPMTSGEYITSIVLLLAVALWISSRFIGLSNVSVAFLALSLLLVSGVLSWRDCLEYTPAWDTLLWFGVVIGMSTNLNTLTFWVLSLVYYIIHYLFASQTAHVAALYTPFLQTMLAAGVDPILAALGLAYVSNLFGSITHYASGQAAAYYGAGYLKILPTFIIGGIFGIGNLAVWFFLGAGWQKAVKIY
ncbi:Sodium/sulfate symporter [Coccomyxa subellipsoidea C-169]|uniref:Sodium/sulfate symporter n=1 Tax=Coccomyxa subellipsoidea (strain C-169) TaxID=574566 RepID=I0YT20_COCSC|nr:Sodium/sulfate symporter [Coccomyxa subellipsoidea C-169]EIE21539.1 Sodium/sulfate symporter [Coccomyxa subellipsoidea C-169]|eukprot:XP_005646083.1 Sodium/sulfate symporter [Coccomyxa subellipsoidea C-169]